ncbi:hypothetical protein MSAN_00419100 [Mycena sanguinolenta]|uniref:Uncharacterized protein n=1 Tax=Mycena sanguinolenta TaxID=230812 RepID=A0A8H6ZDC9_9AGAR|nr:hypothetical protein MSAN_00419100 [Mycena sanguinolenta]
MPKEPETPSLPGLTAGMSIGAYLDDLYAKDEAEQAKLAEKYQKKRPKKLRRLDSGAGYPTFELKATDSSSDSLVEEQSAEWGLGQSTSSSTDVPETRSTVNSASSEDSVIRCGNCSSTTTSKAWYPSRLKTTDKNSKRCGACYSYEWRQGKPRPFLSEDLKCTKCGAVILKKGASYSKIKCGSLLCRPCFQSGKVGHPATAGCSPSCAKKAST